MRISSGQTLSHKSEKLALSQAVFHQKGFDVSRNVALVPTFQETEVDSYFDAFERISTALEWPILLQCKLVGKALSCVISFLKRQLAI